MFKGHTEKKTPARETEKDQSEKENQEYRNQRKKVSGVSPVLHGLYVIQESTK